MASEDAKEDDALPVGEGLLQDVSQPFVPSVPWSGHIMLTH